MRPGAVYEYGLRSMALLIYKDATLNPLLYMQSVSVCVLKTPVVLQMMHYL